ncbi:protein TSSC4 [Anopheles moucheti]|uniref:protein TSSC4 n=1 Tax=Anopheles moucheti TaxID=186751 RepID=UPI0022F06AA2|nr:protein TSSC4 [Anopheles moucheti]
MSFEEKKNLLFSSLETAEQSIAADSILHQENVKEADYSPVQMSKCRIKPIRVDRYQGRESIFKRPNAPIGQCLKRSTAHLPDYKRNPHKWIKYSLEDVDTSDRSNMAAAFSFLKQMEEQREAAENEMDDGNQQHSSTQACRSIVRFNRSVRLRGQLNEADEPVETPVEDRPQFNGRRVLMPEYVVGQKDPKRAKRTKNARQPATGNGKGTELQLDHLVEEEEEIQTEME